MVRTCIATVVLMGLAGIRSIAFGDDGVVFPGAVCTACDTPGLYEKQSNLSQTLLAMRQRLTTWQTDQPTTRQNLECGPWFRMNWVTADVAAQLVDPTQPIALAPSDASQESVWAQRDGIPDGQLINLLAAPPDKVLYLTRTLRSPTASRLTIGVGGGEHLDAWLNGRPIASVKTGLVFDRYGCSDTYEGTRVDQVLLDLDLQAGENILTLRLTGGGEPSFYFSTAPNLVPALWKRIRHDFPAAEHPLLDLVHADWFESAGWLADSGTAREEQLLNRLGPECGAPGAWLVAKLEQLRQSGTPSDDPAWLELCVKGAVLFTVKSDLARLRAAVTALGQDYGTQYPSEPLLARLDVFEHEVVTAITPESCLSESAMSAWLTRLPQLRREMLVDLHPRLRNAEIVFVKRYTYNSKHYYDDFQHIRAWGGNLCVLSLPEGRVRELVPQLAGGVFDRYDLSFDARRIIFGYRRPQPEGYRLYEVGIDGQGLRQVTFPPTDETQRIAKYGRTSYGDGFYGLQGYQFWTDDVHPCYLPDGGIAFASTRAEHGVLCTPAHYLACTNLFRLDPDGLSMRPISQGALSEFSPTVMDDGRVLYNRWEYVYKGIAAAQPLWTMRPDGSGGEEFYGDNIANPGVLWQARQVPGHPHLAVCIGCGHEPLGVGQVLLLNMHKSKRTAEPITSLTPDVKTENLKGIFHLRNGQWREDFYGPLYADPWPLSDQFFLVACNPRGRYNDPAGYGLYLLDVFGNRVPLYHDPEIASWQPMLLEPRTRPPVLPTVSSEAAGSKVDSASLYLSDVYRGLEGVPRGTVKYLRVMEQVPKPWSAELDAARGEDRSADGFGGHLAVSWNAHIWVAVLHGVVPVETDGSAHFQVPADRNLFFQALDENFMEVQRMRTFVNLRPGEARSCIGCHEHRNQAPEARETMASRRPAAALAAQPGDIAPRPLYFPTDVQPLLDRHCVRCHDGSPAGESSSGAEGQIVKSPPDLRGEPTDTFSRSYEAILQNQWVNTIQEWNGGDWAMRHAEAAPPYTYGSHRSRLIELIRNGHYGVRLDPDEAIRLVTWIDCGAPFYGSYFGRRHLSYRGQPDFRPVPTLDSARGIAPPEVEIPPCEPIPSQLLAWWPLNTSSPNEGQSFDGSNFLACHGLGRHDAVSIALRVKAELLHESWNPLLFGDNTDCGVLHFSLLPDGRPNVAINTGGQNWTHRTARSSVAVGEWHHLALVCDARFGGAVRFYLDGGLINEERLSLGVQLRLDGFRLGGWNQWEGQVANNFRGALRDVRIFAGTLSDGQVAQIAAENSIPPTP